MKRVSLLPCQLREPAGPRTAAAADISWAGAEVRAGSRKVSRAHASTASTPESFVQPVPFGPFETESLSSGKRDHFTHPSVTPSPPNASNPSKCSNGAAKDGVPPDDARAVLLVVGFGRARRVEVGLRKGSRSGVSLPLGGGRRRAGRTREAIIDPPYQTAYRCLE